MKGEKMVVERQVTSYVRTTIEVTEITLLSVKEYLAAEIPPLEDWWWLRSPGYNCSYAACVRPGGGVGDDGNLVDYDHVGVRPALRINPRSANLQIGENIRLGDFVWTYVLEGILLCDCIISYKPFRKDWQADDANDYEKSDIKVYLDKWFKNYMQGEETGATENEE